MSSKTKRPGHRVGLMGGTFNPIHNGHLRAAEEICESMGLDQVHFIPAASPPHKPKNPLADYWHRLEMIKIAVSDRPGFWASDLESRLNFPSYTVNTLKAFKDSWGAGTKIFFLVGLDAFLTVHSWHQSAELFKLASFVVFERPGTAKPLPEILKFINEHIAPTAVWLQEEEAFKAKGIKPIYLKPGCRLEISSTDLRKRLDTGSSVRYLVPEAVRLYIENYQLYFKNDHAKNC